MAVEFCSIGVHRHRGFPCWYNNKGNVWFPALGPGAKYVERPAGCRTSAGMNEARFEFRLPADRRRELDELAEQWGLSSAALTRLAVLRLLRQRDALLSPETERIPHGG
jgi:hypothetical protein